LGMSPAPDGDTLGQLAQYGYGTNIFFNLSGEFAVSVIFLAVTIGLKVGSIFCNNERLRSIRTAFRPMWNGYFLAILPRVATFSGFHIRMLEGGSGAINGLASCCIFLLFIFFFIILLLQIRLISSKMEYIEESRF
jgi:hypothetical protein